MLISRVTRVVGRLLDVFDCFNAVYLDDPMMFGSSGVLFLVGCLGVQNMVSLSIGVWIIGFGLRFKWMNITNGFVAVESFIICFIPQKSQCLEPNS